jgi:Trk-type K+ transport system membrane component
MNPRFIMNIALALAGGSVAVASQAFSSSVTGWVTFGVSLGALALLGVARLDRARMLDAATGALAVWAAIASVVYTGSTLTWLSLAEGIGFVGIAVVGLAVLELKNERALGAVAEMPPRAHDGRRAQERAAA